MKLFIMFCFKHQFVVSNIIKYLKQCQILFIFYIHTKHDEIRYLYKQARLTIIVKSSFLFRTTQSEARCKYDVCFGPVLMYVDGVPVPGNSNNVELVLQSVDGAPNAAFVGQRKLVSLISVCVGIGVPVAYRCVLTACPLLP